MKALWTSRRAFCFGVIAAVLVFGFDHVTKWMALSYFTENPQSIEVTSFFNLVLVWNYGVSFGMFSHTSIWNMVFLVGLALAIVAFLARWLLKTERRLLGMALGGVIGGAIGNVVDRLLHGAVVDFLDFHVNNWHWPAFNIADSAISVGAVILIADALFRGEEKPKTEEQTDKDGAA